MIAWVLVALVALVWGLRQLPANRHLSAAWLRAGQDSKLLIDGLALFLTGLARLSLSLTAASLGTLSNGAHWLRAALGRAPSPRMAAESKPDSEARVSPFLLGKK